MVHRVCNEACRTARLCGRFIKDFLYLDHKRQMPLGTSILPCSQHLSQALKQFDNLLKNTGLFLWLIMMSLLALCYWHLFVSDRNVCCLLLTAVYRVGQN